MKTDILHLKNIHHFFPAPTGRGQMEALSIPELTVHKGEFLAVTGPSGSGKSTLINLIAGFFLPSQGTIYKEDTEIQGAGPDRVVVFQKHALFPWLTAFENVAYGLRRQNISAKELQGQVEHALDMVGLLPFAQAYPASLSGGMCQRVALARALILKPDILLLDEPLASLDTATRFRLQDEILQLWKTQNWTVILVTHQLDEAVYMADRIALLYSPPQGLAQILDVPVPRARDRNAIQLKQLTEQLANTLGSNSFRNAY